MFSVRGSFSRIGVFFLVLLQLLANGLRPIVANDLGYYDAPPIQIRLELTIHLTANRGDQLRLSCSDTSLPIAGYPFNWYRNNVTLLSTETITDPRMSIDPENGSLYIADARPEDSAHYKCVLPQRRNEIIVAETELTVLADDSEQSWSGPTTNDVEIFSAGDSQQSAKYFLPEPTTETNFIPAESRPAPIWSAPPKPQAVPQVNQQQSAEYSWPPPTTETIFIPSESRPAPIWSAPPPPQPVSQVPQDPPPSPLAAELRLPNPDPAQPTNVRVQPTPAEDESSAANREALRMRISWQPPALAERLEMQAAGFYYRVFWLAPNSEAPQRWSHLTIDDLDTDFVDVTVRSYELYVARIRLAVNRRLVLRDGGVVQQGSGYPREGRPLEAPRGLRRCDAKQRGDEYSPPTAGFVAFCVQWDPVEAASVQGNLQGYQLYVGREGEPGEVTTTILGAHRTWWDVEREFGEGDELAVFVQLAAMNGRLIGPKSETVYIGG